MQLDFERKQEDGNRLIYQASEHLKKAAELHRNTRRCSPEFQEELSQNTLNLLDRHHVYTFNNIFWIPPMIDYKLILEKHLDLPIDQFPACFAFSIHKAGSTMMHSMIGQVCSAAGVPAINIPTILFQEGIKDREWSNDKALRAFITPGRIYHGYRYLPEFLRSPEVGLKNCKSVLLVRDPRDALVSEYYSFGGKYFSHTLPDKNKEIYTNRADETKSLDIDEYVLLFADKHLKKLEDYKNFLDFKNVLLRRYEQVYFDKRGFLTDIFSHFDIIVPENILDGVATTNDIRPQNEDPTKHIRKGTPGDYLEKLHPKTISKLNNIFQETCAWYGYDLLE